MKVKLTYFKATGKYHAEGEYETELKVLYEIWDEVRHMLDNRKRPGLCDGINYYYVLVEVPEHEHNHPRLIRPFG